MKTFVVFFFFFIFQAGALQAQQVKQLSSAPPQAHSKKSQEERAKMEAAQMRKQLSLSELQTYSYEKIALKYIARQDEIMQQMTTLQTQKSDELKKILTPEQQEKMNQRRQMRNPAMMSDNQKPSVSASAGH
jgi:hypothetical protein